MQLKLARPFFPINTIHFLFGLAFLPLIANAAAPEFLSLLYKLSDGLLTAQITKSTDPDYGALLCPSTNPDNHPTHSRGGEAVYPFAIAFKHSQDAKYSTAAVKLGNWMITKQNAAGYWGEEWPNYDGWNGTTADQLISLAGAYVILKPKMTAQEITAWTGSMKKAADWVAANFPLGNINYVPTGAVALKMAYDAMPGSPASWVNKANSLMDITVQAITSEGFLFGEGKGVDLGYDIAQSIGYITLYSILTGNKTYADKGTTLLLTHFRFMYPNGAIDNSWGTRSYKWMLESGSKTAPGIPFTFALQADKDPRFNRAAQLSLSFLSGHFLDADNRLIYGPHASKHPGSTPACLYPTFARAQSLALSVEYGPDVATVAPIPSETVDWFNIYAAEKTAVIRTKKIMATVTAYGDIDQYPRATVTRGGSISSLWFEGYGDLGFLQTSSQTVYNREEAMHMPTEGALLPLTARIETKPGAAYFSNVLDDKATLAVANVAGVPGSYNASVTGALRNAAGTASGTTFSMVHRFDAASYGKEVTVSSAQNIQIVEPFVDNPGNQYALADESTFTIKTKEGGVWQLHVTSSTAAFTLAAGENRAMYWSPFPGMECYPLTLKLANVAGAQTIKYTIIQKEANPTELAAGGSDKGLGNGSQSVDKASRGWKLGRNQVLFGRPNEPEIPPTTVQGRIISQP